LNFLVESCMEFFQRRDEVFVDFDCCCNVHSSRKSEKQTKLKEFVYENLT
jgi:hypothetical protein